MCIPDISHRKFCKTLRGKVNSCHLQQLKQQHTNSTIFARAILFTLALPRGVVTYATTRTVINTKLCKSKVTTKRCQNRAQPAAYFSFYKCFPLYNVLAGNRHSLIPGNLHNRSRCLIFDHSSQPPHEYSSSTPQMGPPSQGSSLWRPLSCPTKHQVFHLRRGLTPSKTFGCVLVNWFPSLTRRRRVFAGSPEMPTKPGWYGSK